MTMCPYSGSSYHTSLNNGEGGVQSPGFCRDRSWNEVIGRARSRDTSGGRGRGWNRGKGGSRGKFLAISPLFVVEKSRTDLLGASSLVEFSSGDLTTVANHLRPIAN